MSSILVTYNTRTGNTQKVAEAVYAAVRGEKTIQPLSEVTDVNAFDLIFIGFPVHSHSISVHAEDFLKTIPKGKKVALFSTHGSLPGSRFSRQALEYAAVVSSQTKLLGSFACRGKVSPEAMAVLSRSPEHKAWIEMAVSAVSHPDAQDLLEAGEFARWIQTLYHK